MKRAYAHPARRNRHGRRPCGRARARAFSLVEVLISITILSLIIGLSLATFKAGLDTRERAQLRISVEERGRSILARMTERIRAASPGPDPFMRDTLRIAQPVGYRFVGRHIGRTSVESLGEDPQRGYALGLVEVRYLGVDNDGDGRIDEDPWDGIDNDGDFLVDEDPATIPYDILNFTAPLPNGGDLDIVEIGYGIDPRYPQTLRERFRIFRVQRDSLRTFGTYVDLGGQDVDYLVDETRFAASAGALAELAEDVVGLDIHYTFKDGDGHLRTVNNWDTRDPAIVNAELRRAPDTDAEILSDLPMLVTISIWLAGESRTELPRMIQTSIAPANARK